MFFKNNRKILHSKSGNRHLRHNAFDIFTKTDPTCLFFCMYCVHCMHALEYTVMLASVKIL